MSPALTIECLDNIESNISSIEVDTSGAAEELSTAAEYQRKAGRRAACLMIVLVVVVAVVLLAVRATLSNGVDATLTTKPDIIVMTQGSTVSFYWILIDFLFVPSTKIPVIILYVTTVLH